MLGIVIIGEVFRIQSHRHHQGIDFVVGQSLSSLAVASQRAGAETDQADLGLAESALSFLSIGVQPPEASWGTIIQGGQTLLYTRPTVSLAAGIAIVLTVLSLNVLGDGLRDALDPRSKLRLGSG